MQVETRYLASIITDGLRMPSNKYFKKIGAKCASNFGKLNRIAKGASCLYNYIPPEIFNTQAY